MFVYKCLYYEIFKDYNFYVMRNFLIEDVCNVKGICIEIKYGFLINLFLLFFKL